MKSATVTITPRIRAARKGAYVACPRPRPVHRPMAIWAAPDARHIDWFDAACAAAIVAITAGTVAFIYWSNMP